MSAVKAAVAEANKAYEGVLARFDEGDKRSDRGDVVEVGQPTGSGGSLDDMRSPPQEVHGLCVSLEDVSGRLT